MLVVLFFFFKQTTAYEMRISDWSSDVCSSDLLDPMEAGGPFELVVSDGQTSARFVDVLIGEVWFGSGQSNMEVSVKFPVRWAKPEAPYECDEDRKSVV